MFGPDRIIRLVSQHDLQISVYVFTYALEISFRVKLGEEV